MDETSPEAVKPIKILSIEDDEFIRLFLKDVMWIHGVKDHLEFNSVESTSKGKELILNKDTRPDLIFLDLMLPEKPGDKPEFENGFRLLEQIKTDPELMHIKVLVFSSLKDAVTQEKVTRLGADRFLVKGEYMPTELIATVREVLESIKK